MQKQLKGSIVGTVIVLFIVVIIAAAIFFAINNNKSSNYLQKVPSLPNVNGSIPQYFPNITYQPNEQTTSDLKSLTQSHISNAASFTVSYNGNLYFKPSGVGDLATINSPFYLKDSKNGDNIKLYMNATSIPILGSGEIVFISLSGTDDLCTNFNASAVSSKNYQAIFLSNRSVSCVQSSTLAGINFTDIANFNPKTLEDAGVNLSYSKEYQSTYNGMPCTLFSGNLTENILNQSTVGSFEMCYSDKYYVPLVFAANLNGKVGIVDIAMNETTIGNYSNETYVSLIPGPIVK